MLVACVLGYGVLLPWGGRPYPGDPFIQYAQACKWAAITSVVIAQPVIGKLSQVGIERILGTLLGGISGFGAYRVGRLIWDDMYTRLSDGIALSILAAMAAFLGVWAGAKLKLDYSAKLFTLTFLLVTFGAVKQDNALLVMMTRICGICGGVLLSMMASVFIFPRSASQESIRQMAKALTALSEVSSLVWSEGIHHSFKDDEHSDKKATIPTIARMSASLATGLTGGHSSDGAANVNEELCEDKLTAMYNALSKSMEFAGQSTGEIYLGCFAGGPCFLPGFPWWPVGRWQLPAGDFSKLGASMKAVARLLFALHLAFDEGFDDELIALVGQQYPAELFPHLGANAHGCLIDAAESFPSRCIPVRNLLRFHQAVEGLLAISDYRRRQIYQRLRGSNPTSMSRGTRPTRSQSMRSRLCHAAPSSGAATASRTASMHQSLIHSMSDKNRRSDVVHGRASAEDPHQNLPPDQPPSMASSVETMSDIQQPHLERSPFEAFSGLPEDLRIDVFTPSSSPLCDGLETAAPAHNPLTFQQEGGGVGGRDRLRLALPKLPSSEILVFPDTAEGYVNSVRWASFQFLIAELAEESQELHRVLGGLIDRMPHPNPFHS